MRVEALRTALGLSMRDFALAAGIDASSYSKIAKASKPLKIDFGYAISELWGVSLDYLYKGRLDGLPPSLSAKIMKQLRALE